MDSLASPSRPASRVSGRVSGANAPGNEERRESGRTSFFPSASLGQTQGASLAEGEHAVGSSLEQGDGRDPARMQDENFANIFVHFLQTFQHEEEEEDEADGGRLAPSAIADLPEEIAGKQRKRKPRKRRRATQGTRREGKETFGEREDEETRYAEERRRKNTMTGRRIFDTSKTDKKYDEAVLKNSREREQRGDSGAGRLRKAYYMRAMARLIRESHGNRTLVVRLEHVESWQPQGAPVQDAGMRLAEHIRRNYIRIRSRLQESFQLLMEKLAAQMNAPQFSYFLQVVGAQKYVHEIGNIRCNMLGSLLSIRGQVTRTTDVRPELLKAAFKCLECGTIEPDVEQQFKYTQ
ncbi:putative replication licensing factor, partial [Toxoplasma gondii FOU]